MTSLKADAIIALPAPGTMLMQLRERLAEYAAVSGTADDIRVMLACGAARARIGPGTLQVELEAPDTTSLAYLQMGFAEHILDLSGDETPKIIWRGADLAGGPLPYFREMRVVAARNVTPRMRRVRLSGENLERFSHGGLHVRLLLPPAKGVRPVWPLMGDNGRAVWPQGERPVGRVYTIRHIDAAAGWVDIDFVLHAGEDMPGASWAASATPGDVIGMTGPGGGTLPAADHYLLAGDETGLPAIARMLEEMPRGRKVTALIEIADDNEIQELVSSADTSIRWLSRDGRHAGTTSLLVDAVRAEMLPRDERIFVWAGCEYSAFKAVRAYLRTECRLARDKHLAAAYWRRGIAGEDARGER